MSGVDVGYRESIYKVAKCVNCVNARASEGCCEGRETRNGVDCIDTKSSETTGSVTVVY